MKREKWIRVFGAIAAILLLIVGPAFAKVPAAPAAFPFSLDRQQMFSYEFNIKENRSYSFEILFDYAGKAGNDDFQKVLLLLGYGNKDYPGTPLTIRLNITDIGHSPAAERPVYQGTIVTSKIMAHAIKSEGGYFVHEIVTINLKPGTYRVESTALDIPPAFRDRSCRFEIGTNADIRFAPRAVIPPETRD